MTLAIDGPGRDDLAALDRFRAMAAEDLRTGGLRSLDSYQGLFPGHEDVIALAWDALVHDEPPVVAETPVSEELQRLARAPQPPPPALGEIARGGMGAILRIRDEPLGRDLAMKVLLGHAGVVPRDGDESGDDDSASTFVPTPSLRRFLREAHITAQLAHPGIPPVHSLGIDTTGRVYFTMKLVKGRTLAEVFALHRRKEEGWTRERVLQVLVRVCETVAFAHNRQVIHRDIKPPNVMVGKFGEVYLMDWGLARTLGSAGEEGEGGEGAPLPEESGLSRGGDPVTVAGSVLGTPFYMPPEQAAGRHDRLDARADVYALGAMLYELMAGCPPYAAPGEPLPNALVALARVGGGPPTPLGTLAPASPPELLAIVARAMARDPADRYATADALREDLVRFLEGRTVRAHRTGPVVELRKWIQRNRTVASLLVATVLAVTIGTTRFALREREVAVDLAAGKQRAEEARDRADESARRADAAARRAEGLRLGAISWTVVGEKPLTALQLAIEGAERAPGVASNDALFTAMAATREMDLLSGHDSYVRDARLDAAGRRLLSAEEGRQVILWDLPSGNLRRRLLDHDAPVTAIRISADGTRAVTGDRSGIVLLWDLDGAAPPLRLGTSTGEVTTLEFSRDRRHVAAGRVDGRAQSWNAETGEEEISVPAGPERLLAVDPGPSGDRLITLDVEGTVSCWRAGAADPLWSTPRVEGTDPWLRRDPPQDRDGPFLLPSPDGTTVVARRSETVDLLDAATGRPLRSVPGPEGSYLQAMAFDGGARLVAGWRHPREEASTVLTLGTADLEELHRDRIPWVGRSLAVSGGRRGRIAVTDGSRYAATWLMGSPASFEVLRGHLYGISGADFAPGGGVLITHSNDGTLRTWNMEREGDLDGVRWPSWHILEGDAGLERVLIVDPREELWTNASRTLRVADARTGALLGEPIATEGAVGTASLFPGDRCLLGDAGGLRVLEFPTGRVVASLPVAEFPLLANVGESIPGPDGRRVLVQTTPGGPVLVDLERRTVESLPWLPRGRTAVAPDGTALLVGGGPRQTASVWDLASRTETHRLIGHSGYLMTVGWSPVDGRVVTTAMDTTVRLWDPRTGREQVRIAGLPMIAHQGVFSPDGRMLAVRGGGSVHVYDAETGVRRFTAGFPETVAAVRFLEGGRLAVFLRDSIRLLPLDPLPAARLMAHRPLSATEMEFYEVGTSEERAQRSREEEAAVQRVTVLARRAMALLGRGEREEARRIIDRALVLRPGYEDVLVAEAVARALDAGEAAPGSARREEMLDRALGALERASAHGGVDSALLLREPLLEPLRAEPRFAALGESLIDAFLASGSTRDVVLDELGDISEDLLGRHPHRVSTLLRAARARAYRASFMAKEDPARPVLIEGAMEVLLRIPPDGLPAAEVLRDDPAFAVLRDDPRFP